jgi:hypothetical protein
MASFPYMAQNRAIIVVLFPDGKGVRSPLGDKKYIPPSMSDVRTSLFHFKTT